jgi:hypothetical protein
MDTSLSLYPRKAENLPDPILAETRILEQLEAHFVRKGKVNKWKSVSPIPTAVSRAEWG